MHWLSVADRAASLRFGWVIGTASGLYIVILVALLILSAPAYHLSVPRAVGVRFRKISQWALTFAPIALFILWVVCGYLAREFLSSFVTTLSFAMLSIVAPIMLLLMLSAANRVGEAMGR
jgi:uncharacterized membrane protein YhdT